MKTWRYDPSGKLDRILENIGIPKESFQSFMKLPYAGALDAARQALVNPNAEFAFLRSQQDDLSQLPKSLLGRPVSEDDRLRQIYIDRIFQFYLMKTFYVCSETNFKNGITVIGLDKIDRHLASGRGVLLINSHYGPAQLIQLTLSRLGYNLSSVAARDFYGVLGIEQENITVIPLVETFPARVIAQGCDILRAGKMLHMTGDGYTGLSGREYEFFGRKRAFTNSFGYMADRTNAICLPVFTSISIDGHITINIKSAIRPDLSLQDQNERFQKMTTRYVNFLRNAWREDPASIPPNALSKFQQLPKSRKSALSKLS